MANSPDSDSESARVADRLRNDILDGMRLPGARLVERDLAEELGVSRVPVREALKELSAEGLVVLRPRTWAIVREFTPSDVADFYEVHNAFETLAFGLAAQRHTREGLSRLRAAVDVELAAAAHGDEVAARRAAADFHQIVVDLAANTLLTEIGEFTGSRMRWFMSQHDDLLAVARQHETLYDAIARRDIDIVTELAAEHLRESKRRHLTGTSLRSRTTDPAEGEPASS